MEISSHHFLSFLIFSLIVSGSANAEGLGKSLASKEVSSPQSILLSKSEQEYLNKRETITYCVDPDWMPFEAIKDARHIGMAGDYMSLMRERISHPFELVVTKSWDETLNLAKKRDCDIIPFLNKTEKREEYLAFTAPYVRTPQVIVTLDDVLYIDGFTGLAGQTMAVTEGYKTEELVKSKFPEIKLIAVESQAAGLLAVSEGRAYAVVGSLIVLSDQIRALGLANLKVSGKTAFYDEFRVGVRNDDPMLLDIMKKAVASITVAENNNLFRKWTAIRFVEGIDYTLLWRLVGIFALFIILGGFYYFMALKRNRELNVLKSNLEHQTIVLAEQRLKEKALNKKLHYEIGVKDRFFSIIAHDLKSPFNSLLGMTQMMSKMSNSFSKDELIDYATNVNEAGNRVYVLLRNLLDWSQLQMKGVKVEAEKIAMRDLIQETINLLSPIAQKKDISLINSVDKVIAFADRDMVNVVIRNLLDNAIKFTPRGGSVEVFSQQTDDGMTKITVSDTGIGITAKRAKNIFSLDQKTSTTGTSGELGTGLGLPLCKDMLERNGGRIWVEVTQQEGSKFHFSLPMPPRGMVTD